MHVTSNQHPSSPPVRRNPESADTGWRNRLTEVANRGQEAPAERSASGPTEDRVEIGRDEPDLAAMKKQQSELRAMAQGIGGSPGTKPPTGPPQPGPGWRPGQPY